jgi:hypothetical protein
MSLGMLSQTAEPRISQQIRAQLLPVAGHDSDRHVRELA